MRIKIAGILMLGAILTWMAVRQSQLERRLDALIAEQQSSAEETTSQQQQYEEVKAIVEEVQHQQAAPAFRSSPVAAVGHPPVQSAPVPPENMPPASGQEVSVQNASSMVQPVTRLPTSEYNTSQPQAVNPSTYIDPATQEVRPKRSWGYEQSTGIPDTDRAGDIPTAWASRDPDGGFEWLALQYEEPLDLLEVRIRETFNPGAIAKVTALVNGQEVTLWEGTAPSGGTAPRDFVVPVPQNVWSDSIVVHMDTTRVSGWNEIDAVEIVGRDGRRRWATSAAASTTYAEPRMANSAAVPALLQPGDFGNIQHRMPDGAPW